MSIRQGSTIIAGSSGSGGTSNYNNLENKPSINGITLEGNKTTEDLNINSLPDQTGNEGKVLITNGTEASWQTLPEAGLPLFAHIWSDHLLTNTSYLRADTFSWQDGNIYYTAYNELVNEKNLTTETSTDTINDITITYYRTPKGYKIVLPDMADTIAQLYENTGTAWYYILDTDNTRFKLPRSSRYESGTTIENAGDFSAESLPNITGSFNGADLNGDSPVSKGAFLDTENNAGGVGSGASTIERRITFDASRSSSTYKNGARVNTDHITQFLYFYVGNTVQNETTIDVAEITEALNKKADRDLNNLTEDATNAVKPSDITNCITKIPQDIKLELNAGALTLKAGSRVYVPNGVDVFNVVNITEDITVEGASSLPDAVRNVYYVNGTLAIYLAHSSGTTIPSSGANQVFYNTSDNTVKVYTNGSVIRSGLSFPIARVLDDGTYLSGNIDRVFNGFGYIGNTIFALPGVEGLIPNGRNTDGSLNNAKFTTTSIMTFTESDTTNAYSFLRINQNSFGPATVSIANRYYDEETNYNIFNGVIDDTCRSGYVTYENGRITSFSPKSVFQAVDRNDTEWASTVGKPSDRYVNLSIQASGTQYTAPANGWLQISGKATQNGGYVILDNPQKFVSYMATNSIGNYDRGFIPVSKGNKITLLYGNYEIESEFFKFIYDEGSK